jgi:alcohol dehydrogenase (cytochrome c)
LVDLLRDYQGHRFSPLAEIKADNVSHLTVKWAYQFPDPNNEVSPIVVDNIMYVSGPNSATALDAHTGRVLWNWKRPLPSDYHSIGFRHVSRGPAVLDDKLYVATLDCYLVALDVKSGIERWAVKVADYKTAYSMTLAPLAINGKVVVGVSGGEAGIRGFVDAYDAKTGKRAWRFWTIPGPGDPGHDSWAGDSWKTGGGPTWVTGTYDPDLNLVFWGVGNPSPDWNGDPRNGDNLYTCSLLALDADTGRLRWYFQFTPHDTHDCRKWGPYAISANLRITSALPVTRP